MLTPTVANRTTWFYAVGNTPATSLTRCIPHGQDADILSLGSGDLRNILFTAYVEQDLPSRKLDITCCDIDERVIGRNIIFLTLLIDGQGNLSKTALWSIYYHLYLDEPAAQFLRQQCQKLLPLLGSLEAWKKSKYGEQLQFCDVATLNDVRSVCKRLVLDETSTREVNDLRNKFRTHLKASLDVKGMAVGKETTVMTGLRSAAPLSLQSQGELPKAYEQYWQEGTATPNKDKAKIPNPMFANLVSEYAILHYGTDPVLGFHLATAYAPLSDNSPLKPQSRVSGFKAAEAAQAQFDSWVTSFQQLCKKGLTLRFVVADVYAFCHTIQRVSATPKTMTANWYRRQFDNRFVILDEDIYTKKNPAPVTFDMIDTSNLADHFGALNLLVAMSPLLKPRPWSTASTELLIKSTHSQKEILDKILCGDAVTISLLLGLVPVQQWTNAKCESHVDEVFLGLIGQGGQGNETQMHCRLSWKLNSQFSEQTSRGGRLKMDSKPLSRILYQVYKNMFAAEATFSALTMERRETAYPHFHRSSFVSFLKLVMNRINTDWDVTCMDLLESISQDTNLILSSNQLQELYIQLHLQGVRTTPFILGEVKSPQIVGPMKSWRSIPPAVSVTVLVPRERIDRIFEASQQHKTAAPTLLGSLRSGPAAESTWHNMFADLHIVFGKVKTTDGEYGGKDVEINADDLGWSGTSDLIASFVVPTAALQVEAVNTLVGICVAPSVQSAALYFPVLGMDMTVFETKSIDEARVFVSNHMPGQNAFRVDCGGVRKLTDHKGDEDSATQYTAEIPSSETKVTAVTGHVDVMTSKGKKLLQDKVPIKLHQTDPFTIEVVFSDGDLQYSLTFPVPVSKEGSKTRVARTSCYVEVIAPLANVLASDCLANFVFPSLKGPESIPVSLNTPHMNLDRLPILDVQRKDAMRWLTTMTSLQFSAREKRLRDDTDKSGLSGNIRVNFKESLFTMFMLVSGLQGGQTGLFAINHPDRGGIHMLIFVSAMRLDGDSASVVLDAAVIPFTTELITSGRMESFLLLMRELECCTMSVNDEELVLWKKVLPSLAERCRIWSHKPKCEYKKKDASVPLSLDFGKQVLCSCGNGVLPDKFVSLPEWKTAAPNAVRIAISPTFPVAIVEEVVDMSVWGSTAGVPGKSPVVPGASGCRKCGKVRAADGGELKRCMRCKETKYCSGDCQKQDWKKHRMECLAPPS